MVICAEMFEAKLKAEGLKYTVRELDEQGGVSIGVMFNGVMTNVIFQGDDNGKHVGFRTVLENCPKEKMLDVLLICNALNMRYRWLKFYVDNDNDIMIADDAIVSPETAGEECFELLIRTAQIIRDCKPLFMKTLYGGN